MEYTLSLALVDFLPVFFTGVGFVYIVRLVSYILPLHGGVALLGAVLTVAGGFFKALWKLFMASSKATLDIGWMEDGLFVFMAPGYSMLAWGVWQTARSVQGKRVFSAWSAPLAFIVLMFAVSYSLSQSRPDTPAWERVLLSVTVLATVFSGILLIAFAFRQRLLTAGVLFAVNLIGIFILNGLARLSEQPIALQWLEESINAFSWLAFAVGAWQVYQYARANFGVDNLAATRYAAPAE